MSKSATSCANKAWPKRMGERRLGLLQAVIVALLLVGFSWRFRGLARPRRLYYTQDTLLTFSSNKLTGIWRAYKQITNDTGSGATPGAFRGRAFALGPALTYTTRIGNRPLIIAARHYQEFGVQNRFGGNMTTVSITRRF
ncbi:MAG: hypothetical protein EKE20_03445 [Candidatus Symbiopectobacterium sp. Dall1.0]|nr:hypothetical protein [Candidatus Symbiopectobacterium sp. Dall1.0]